MVVIVFMENDPGSKHLITKSAIKQGFHYREGTLGDSSSWPLLCSLPRTHRTRECKVRSKTAYITLASKDDGSEIVHMVVLSAVSPFLTA